MAISCRHLKNRWEAPDARYPQGSLLKYTHIYNTTFMREFRLWSILQLISANAAKVEEGKEERREKKRMWSLKENSRV